MKIPSLYKIFQKNWEDFQTCYIISDTHFNDEELREAQPNRPSDAEFVESINSKVGRKDILIHLGDVGDIEYIKQLRGYKILIMGNHDAGRSNYERRIEQELYDVGEYTKEEAIKQAKAKYPGWKITSVQIAYAFHKPFESWLITVDNQLFDEVYEGPLIIGEKLLLSHEPIPNCKWCFNIHGHTHHEKAKNDKYHYNCCAEAINYTPINFNQWMKEGYLAHIDSIHRTTIDFATEKKNKRNRKNKSF